MGKAGGTVIMQGDGKWEWTKGTPPKIANDMAKYSTGVSAVRIDEVNVEKTCGIETELNLMQHRPFYYITFMWGVGDFLEKNRPHVGGYLCYKEIDGEGQMFFLPAHIFEALFTLEDK